jgi:uncharacterized membrane-anchored protein YhcB (DUF1043 family)
MPTNSTPPDKPSASMPKLPQKAKEAEETASAQEQLDKMRARVDEKRDDHQAKVAEGKAELAEAYTAHAATVAQSVIDDTKTADVEAAEARKAAEEHRPSAPAPKGKH